MGPIGTEILSNLLKKVADYFMYEIQTLNVNLLTYKYICYQLKIKIE